MSNKQTYEKSAGGVILPPTSNRQIPSIDRDEPLEDEKNKISNVKQLFFSAIWAFLAVTTFFFGFQNLSVLFRFLVDWLPFQPQSLDVIASWLGGIMALLFLDAGYKGWNYMRMYVAETSKQINNARTAEIVAFIGSVYFTIAVITTAFADVLPTALISFLGLMGIIVFVTSCAVTMVCSYLFLANSVEGLTTQQYAENRSKETTEILKIQSDIKAKSLKLAKAELQQAIPQLSKQLSEGLKNDFMNDMRQQLSMGADDDSGK